MRVICTEIDRDGVFNTPDEVKLGHTYEVLYNGKIQYRIKLNNEITWVYKIHFKEITEYRNNIINEILK